MSDITVSTPTERAPRPKKTKRPTIIIDGDKWMALETFAARIGVSPKEADKLNLLSVLIGDAIYVNATEGLREIAARARRRFGWES
jgi:hypothetical protein